MTNEYQIGYALGGLALGAVTLGAVIGYVYEGIRQKNEKFEEMIRSSKSMKLNQSTRENILRGLAAKLKEQNLIQ